MAQNDMNVANQGFPAFRADLNDQLEALVTNSSGATAPATTFPHQWWLDTSTTPSTLRQRNAANDAWIVVGLLNQSTNTFNVPVAQGGTGLATLTANNVLLGNGTSAVQAVAPGTSGNVLTSNGTTWISDVLPASGLGIGQTWQAVTRTPNVTYTNTTGKPICFLMIMIGGSGSNQQVDLTIGATTITYFIFSYFLNGVVQGQNVAIIPDGSTYSYTSTGNTTRDVYELR
jgi:hypothetical protein